MMADFKGVDPKRVHAAEFEKEVKQEYLNPFFESILATWAAIGFRSSPTVLIELVGMAANRWDSLDNTRKLEAVAERWANRVDTYHEKRFVRDFIKVARVDVRPALHRAPIRDALKDSINESVRLIKTIIPRFGENLSQVQIAAMTEEIHEQVAKGYIKGELDAPLDLQARERLMKKGFRGARKSAGYNLRRIVRDQSNKLTGALSEARQKAVGVEQYLWRTSEDDRVRPTHAEKNGRIFSWDQSLDTGPPGHDIQCRCVAIPHITIEQIRSRSGRPT